MKKYRLLYALLFAASVAFSQIYKGHFSLVLLITVVALPVLSFLLQLIGFFAAKVGVDLSDEVYEKNQSFRVSIKVKNRFFIPIAPAVISVSLPQPSASVDDGELVFSLAPFQSNTLKMSYILPYRGQYTFTLKKFKCYDMLKLFCLSRSINAEKKIVVLPRRIELDAQKSVGAEKEDITGGRNSRDGSELNFIRKYYDGDDFRQIHWKLSAKQDDYMVRQMMEPDNLGMIVYCDFRAYSVSAEENALAADRVAEAAVALIYNGVKNSEESLCVWYDSASGAFRKDVIAEGSHFYSLYNDFARATVYSESPDFSDVVLSCAGQQTSERTLCLVTPRVDGELEKMLERMSAANRIVLVLTSGEEKSSLSLLRCNNRVSICPLGEDIKASLEAISDR